MAIQFSVHKTPQPNDRKGQQQTHARAIARSTQKMDDICALVCERGSISSADVKAVLDSFVWVIGIRLNMVTMWSWKAWGTSPLPCGH